MANKFLYVGGRDDDGTAKGARVDVDGKFKVKESGKLGSEINATLFRNIEIDEIGVSKIVLDTTKPINLELFVWITTDDRTQITLQAYTGTGSLSTIGDILYNGVSVDSMALSPANIIDHGSSLFEINKYQENYYKFTLKDKLMFPHGVRISFVNNVQTGSQVGARIYGAEYND